MPNLIYNFLKYNTIVTRVIDKVLSGRSVIIIDIAFILIDLA